MKQITLSKTVNIPVLGFGTWRLNGNVCIDSVLKAFETGYRHIDTADMYANHKEVGIAIKKSGLKRNEIFLTTKVPPTDLSGETVLANCDRYLEELGISYIDLLLVHWPNKTIPLKDTLLAMDKLKKSGKIKAIGVSNFTIHHLKDALKTGIEVVNNQVELHPSFNQFALQEFTDENNIVLTAYSPLGRGSEITNPVIQKLAKKYGRTPAQIILNWIMGRNVVAIPKSATPKRIKENFLSTSFELEASDRKSIDSIKQEPRLVDTGWSEFDY